MEVDGDDAAANRFLSEEALAREPHSLRALAPLLQVPDVIWLAGGTPHGDSFPIAQLSMTLTDGRVLELSAEEVYLSQQYCMRDQGHGPLAEWVREHVQALHAPPRRLEQLVTCGNTNGLDLALRCLLSRGDCVLTEEYTYAATLQAMHPMGLELLGVPSDAHGPCCASLREVLCARREQGKPLPKLMYCVPVSANPTGITWSMRRKEEMYALACEFDFLLLEDDAYFYLQFDASPGAVQPGLHGLGRSLLSLDIAGRVVRVDTVSKFLAPGLRVGWASVQGASSLAQVAAAKLLTHWGAPGLHEHLSSLQRSYAVRCAALARSAATNLVATDGVTPLATWTVPSAGMFLWLHLGCGVLDSESLQEALKLHKVVVVPGKHFHCYGQPTPFVRLSFASASEEQFERGMQRLGTLLRSLLKD